MVLILNYIRGSNLSFCPYISSLSALDCAAFFLSPKLILISASYRSPVGKVTVAPVTLCQQEDAENNDEAYQSNISSMRR